MLSIFDACRPRDEVLSGELKEEIFAARLRDVIEGRAEAVYADPQRFFDNTYPTDGLKALLSEALGRLSGAKPTNNAIIRLETAFGGGKTHNLIALYHVARGFVPPPQFVEAELVPSPGGVKVAGVVGSDLDPTIGLSHGEVTTYTLWGEIAYQLGGDAGYELVRRSEQDKTAPGTSLLEHLIGDKPALIMLDEVARYLRTAKSVPTATGRSDLAEQTVAFLMSLFEFAASKQQVVVVLTLADVSDAFGQESEELRQQIDREIAETRRLSARQERVITPSTEKEIAAIVTHRLFRHIDRQAAADTARAYLDYYQRCVELEADLPQKALRAEYGQEIEADYPFHPELLNTLNRKVSTIPNFQRTRGALRLLAMVVRSLWQNPLADVFLIHPHHVDLAQEDIVNDLTSRLERPRFKQVIEADIVSTLGGSLSHAQTLDANTGSESLAQRVATTIFIHSLTQGVASGVDPGDLTLAVLAPQDDPALILKAAERLTDVGWFLEYDGRRFRFKTEPSLNKIIADEVEAVGLVQAKMELDRRIRTIWKKGYFQPVFFPNEPVDIEDNADTPKLVIVHYDAATTREQDKTPPDLVMRLFNYAGAQEGYRTYKNNLVFLVADHEQRENMVAKAKHYLAIQRILGDPERLREFYEEQREKLKKMGEVDELQVRVAITKAYRWLYYPSGDAPQAHANLARERLEVQDQGDTKIDQSEVVLGLLKSLEKVLTQDSQPLAAKYVLARAWDTGQTHLTTEELRRAFARKMSLRMVLDINQLRKTIVNGIEQGVWVYYDAREQMGYNAQSPRPAIRIGDDTSLYLPEEYARLGWPIKGVILPSARPGAEPSTKTCPICGNPIDRCACGATLPKSVVVLKGEGVPAQAFQHLYDLCVDHHVERLRRLTVRFETHSPQEAGELRALGLAIPQVGKGAFWIDQTFTAEFGDGEDMQVTFRGGWERYKRLKVVTEPFAQEAQKLSARTTLQMEFAQGLEVRGEQFRAVRAAFEQFSFGAISVHADPFDEDDRR